MTSEDQKLIEDALRGLDYPAPRGKLVEVAKDNNAPRRVIDLLLEMPETADFQDAEELRRALGVSVPPYRPTGGWQ